MAAQADEGFSFGDFTFATPLPQSTFSNGGLTSTSTSQDDDDWGDFFVAPPQTHSHTQTQTQTHTQPALSNGFSYPPQSPVKNLKSSINFDPFFPMSTPPASDLSPIRPDPKTALPLSLFGELEDNPDSNSVHSNGLLDPKLPTQNGKIGVDVATNGGEIHSIGGGFGDLYIPSQQQIKPEIGSGFTSGGLPSNLNNLEDGDEGDDDWEFMGAFPGNGVAQQNKDPGASVASTSKVEPVAVVMTQEKQAGQDASSSADRKDVSNTTLPQFMNLFAAHHGAIHKSSEVDVGLNNSSTTLTTNGFVPDLFNGIDTLANESGTIATPTNEEDDFDDFGDFVDASQEFGPQKEDQCSPQNVGQSPSEKIQDQQIELENSGGPLPLSLFSDGLEESSDGLTQQDEIFQKPVSISKSGFNTQGQGISIHDLLSNLYSQAPQASSVDSSKSPAETGVHSPEKIDHTTTIGDDDDWDEDSWEFKDAHSESEIKEKYASASPGSLPQELSETMSNLLFCMELYKKLGEYLCILLSDQLNGEKSSDALGDNGNAEAFSHDVQDVYKLLEDNISTEEILSKRHLDKSHCLTEILEALQGPKCKVIESAYSLSERLQLATKDWRVAAELSRHAISVLHILSLASADVQTVYVSSWSKIISVCAQELKHGAFIWKRALEKNLRAQILSDYRGEQYIRALGEIYKIVELLRLSTELYKPWVLVSVSDPQQLYGLLDECASLWSTSGLEGALEQISDSVRQGLGPIKNIHNVDVLVVHDSVFIQRQSLCRLSLLPQELLSDLKVVEWNNNSYFLILANLWANLVSPNPPQLPSLLIS